MSIDDTDAHQPLGARVPTAEGTLFKLCNCRDPRPVSRCAPPARSCAARAAPSASTTAGGPTSSNSRRPPTANAVSYARPGSSTARERLPQQPVRAGGSPVIAAISPSASSASPMPWARSRTSAYAVAASSYRPAVLWALPISVAARPAGRRRTPGRRRRPGPGPRRRHRSACPARAARVRKRNRTGVVDR
jgi:hypothetical protein